MGAVVSHHHGQKDVLFVDKELEDSHAVFTGRNNSTDDFVKYIKDGSWIDHLADSTFFSTHKRHFEMKVCTVTFYTTGLILQLVGSGEKKLSSISSTSSSASTRDSYHAAVENFAEIYLNIEENTCFKTDEMMAFLISIVYPFYILSGSRKAKRTAMNLTTSFDDDEDDCTTAEDATVEDADLGLLQELLLSTAAFFDESDLRKTLASQDWMYTLCRAVNECTLDVCICAVDPVTKTFPPVLISTVARKRIWLLNKSSKHEMLDFLQLWSIEYEEALNREINQNLLAAEPMQLFAAQSFSDRSKTVLEVTHIFDEQGVHRYVLGVQMTVPMQGRSKSHLQYLRGTSLLIAHLVKTSAPLTSVEGLHAC